MKHRWLQTSASPSVVLLPAVRTSCWNLVEIQILMIAGQKLEGDIFMQEPFSNPWVIETSSHLSQLCCLGLVPQVVWDWKKSVTLGSSFSCLVEGLYSHTASHAHILQENMILFYFYFIEVLFDLQYIKSCCTTVIEFIMYICYIYVYMHSFSYSFPL